MNPDAQNVYVASEVPFELKETADVVILLPSINARDPEFARDASPPNRL
jgi:hypothetical protein